MKTVTTQIGFQEPLFITEKTVSLLFGIGLQQLRELRARGGGPAFFKISGTIGRPGGRILYDRREIEAWIQRRPRGGEQAQGGLR
jgi:hypothetical protein